MSMAARTGIAPRKIRAEWLNTEFLCGVALNQIEAAEQRISMDPKVIQSIEKDHRKREQLHKQMLADLNMTRGEKREREEATRRLTESMNRPQRRSAPLPRSSQSQGNPTTHQAPRPGAPSRHFSKDGNMTLPPLPTEGADK